VCEQCLQRVEDFQADAREATTERIDLERQDQSYDLIGQRFTDTGCVR